MNVQTRKKYYNFGNKIGYYFNEYKTYLIAFCGVFLLGVVVGCFSYVKFNSVFNITELSKHIDVNVFVNKVGFFSFSFTNFFKYVFNILIIFLLGLTFYLFPLMFLFVGYLGYLLGSSCVVIIIVLGAGGLIGMILFYIPLTLCIYFLIINLACICEKKAFDAFKFGKYYGCNGEFGYSLKTFLIVIMAIFILCLLCGIFFPQTIKSVLNSV